jgi:hypothetical protein
VRVRVCVRVSGRACVRVLVRACVPQRAHAFMGFRGPPACCFAWLNSISFSAGALSSKYWCGVPMHYSPTAERTRSRSPHGLTSSGHRRVRVDRVST